MRKKISLATLGIVSSTLIGCSNQVESIQPVQQNQQVNAQSNFGLNNVFKNYAEIMFKFIDKDNDGFISQKDYMSISNGSISVEEKTAIFRKIDKDNDGKINLEDIKLSLKLFLSGIDINKDKIRDSIQEFFSVIDTNKDKFINESEFINSEFTSYFKTDNSSGDFVIKVFLFESTDKNHDKKVSFSEFEDFEYNIMTSIMKGSLLGSSVSPTP
ncbi:MAG: EF-hand domain-containing protein [Candidatus Sericytochromatia bacterium]